MISSEEEFFRPFRFSEDRPQLQLRCTAGYAQNTIFLLVVSH